MIRKILPWLVFIFMFATNYWYSWNDAITKLQVHDVPTSYQKMIESAPEWPKEKIAYHHAQRFIPFFGVSLLAKFTHIPYEVWFRLLSVVIVLASAGLMYIILKQIHLPWEWRYFILSLWILNPYAFRYYLAAPVMIVDLFFVFGMLLVFCGLVKNISGPLFLGLLVAIVSRQTALLLLPTILIWLIFKNRQYIRAVFAGALGLGLYFSIGRIVAIWAEPSVNSHSVFGLYYWLSGALGEIVSAKGFFEHILRVMLPVFLSGAIFIFVIVRNKKIGLESILFLLAMLAILAQPFMAGPIVAGGNAGRLSGLALAPLLVALAFALKDWLSKKELTIRLLPGFTMGLAFLSLHHAYCYLGIPANPLQFTVIQLLGSLIWLVLFIYMLLRQGKLSK